jgi:hypothetical protein
MYHLVVWYILADVSEELVHVHDNGVRLSPNCGHQWAYCSFPR